MNKHTQFTHVLFFLFLMQSLVGCANDNNTDNKSSYLNNSKENKGNNVDFNKEKLSFSSLIIDHKCIGCGRCTMTDPEHFVQYRDSSVATVKSQQNLESKKIRQAIQICPTRSIKLI